jgi:hypothetical protein
VVIIAGRPSLKEKSGSAASVGRSGKFNIFCHRREVGRKNE